MSPSPSFNSFSDSNLAGIAARVVQEFEDGVQDGEFEFTCENSESLSAVTADEIFHNGKILPVYPSGSINETRLNSGTRNKTGPPLRNLFAQERELMFTSMTSSSSSSDVDELDGVPADTYCLWRPKAAAEEEGRWKTSSFPGSISKKWNLKDFLQRSFSVGSKDIGLILLSPKEDGGGKNVGSNVKRPPVAARKSTPPPPYNRGSGEKRRPYLPHGQHQVGFFAYMNVWGKNLHPF